MAMTGVNSMTDLMHSDELAKGKAMEKNLRK
jgi:hypothetical protein